MKIEVTGYQADDIVSALNSSCADADALLQNAEFMTRYKYLGPTLNRHIESCRQVQDQITNALASELSSKLDLKVKW